MKYVWLFLLVVTMYLVGFYMRGAVDKALTEELHTGVMSYGYEEKSQLWYRIRVDEKGNVMCHKE